MTKLDFVFNPYSIGNKFGTRRRIRFDVATGPDMTSIGYLDRNYNYTVIDFTPDGNPRKVKTEDAEIKFVLANGIDKFKIRHIVTDDEYLVWNEIEKALSVTDVASIHDIDGFTKLIPINNYFPGKKSSYHDRMNNCDTEASVYIHHDKDQSASSSDFADAIALQCQIITDRVSVVHTSEREPPFGLNVSTELIPLLVDAYEIFQKKHPLINMITIIYGDILILENPSYDQMDYEF